MPYQPKPMLPSDLRDFSAPNWWRENAHRVWAAVFFALVVWHAYNEITGAGQPATPMRQAETEVKPASAPSLDCPRLVRGQWLYGAIRHAGDIEPLRIDCFYGHGGARFIQ